MGNTMYSLLIDLIPGAVAGAVISWLLRGWIAERLKHAIAHEYSAKLENLKNELNGKLESLKHSYEVSQLRTSLFFDHQRAAFAEILAKSAEVNQKWWDTYEPEVGLMEPVPSTPYQELKALYVKHQLFLDSDSIMAMELLFEIYRESFPFNDGEKLHHRDPRGPHDKAEYLQPRLAALFQKKIGVATDARAVRQLALLGGISILNRYHFASIGLPTEGALKLDTSDGAAEAVMKAERNLRELLEKMRAFQSYLQTETAFFHEAEASLSRYLAVLDQSASAEAYL
jgi:hypothetical protein